MKPRLFCALVPLLLAAQDAPPAPPAPPPPPEAGQIFTYSAIPAMPAMSIEGVAHRGKPVVNAPYQAQVESQTTQRLADGNVIQNSHTSKVARDSKGRTWTEETITRVGPWSAGSTPRTIIFISDPVGGTSYVLHPDSKTAEKMSVRHLPVGPGKVNVFVTRRGPGEPPAGGVSAAITAPDGPPPPAGKMGPGDEQKEDLGTQQVNGVAAQGTRITRTIPANTIGNQLPIVSVTETWYSPDLQIMVQTKHDDPRFGESTMSLKNIQKGEPPSDLFEVPADYTVTEGPKMAMPLKP